MSPTLTPRQADVLRALQALTRANGAPPSAQAIGDRLGVTRQAATKHLSELERLGLVHDEPVLVRSGKWRVVSE
jgi:Mn-dependent DtxR family transcriptional regulator